MSYPTRLLPKINYTYMATECLPKESSLLRITQTQDNADLLGKVKNDAMLDEKSYHQVFGLSVNIYGPFLLDDIKFQIISKDLNNYWNEADECLEYIQPTDYTITESRGAIFLYLFSLHNKPFPYSKNINNEERDFIGTCIVIHKPTKCNFWHFEIKFKEQDGKIIKSKDVSWQKRLQKHLIKSFIKKFAFVKEPEKVELSKEIYCKL